jgi:uncharacterized membrane protein (GlpM family)
MPPLLLTLWHCSLQLPSLCISQLSLYQLFLRQLYLFLYRERHAVSVKPGIACASMRTCWSVSAILVESRHRTVPAQLLLLPTFAFNAPTRAGQGPSSGAQ